MFDLNKAIKDWECSLNKQKSLEDGYREELKSHFSEIINEGIKNGLSEEDSFNKAVDEIGNLKNINSEYKKSDSPNYKSMNSWYSQIFIPALILNYIKIAIRSFNKNKGYSFINIGGLSVGLTVVFFVTLYINYETSFDKHFNDSNRIYRVVKDFVFEDGIILDATTPPALAPALKNELPEVETSLRIMPSWGAKYLMSHGEKKFYEEGVYRADSNFFEVFNAEVVKGNINDALKGDDGIILTESMAKKYFGNENPISKTIHQLVFGREMDRIVKAVIKDFPENTHFKFDFLIPMIKNVNENWGWYNYYTYAKLKKNISPAGIDSKIQEIFKKNVPERDHQYYTQKLTDIHLTSNLKWELQSNGSIQQVYTFATVAVFVLLIAGINYINLSTAKSSSRSKEVGLRKVSGAGRQLLIKQFLIESIVTTTISFLISIVVLYLTLPFLNSLFNTNLNLFSDENINFIFMMFGASVLIGVLSGIYPALYLSGFQPVDVLKGMKTKGGIVWLRRGLVVFQFLISTVLITGTIIIQNQLSFIENYKLGFEKEQVIALPNADNLSNFNSFKNELKNSSLINNVSMSSGVIGQINWTRGIRKKGAENDVLTNFLFVDYDFLDVMKMEIAEGRFFSREFPSDYENGVVLSEQAVKEMAVEEPVVGKQIVWAEDNDSTIYANVIGVVKDFNFTSLHQKIKPFAFKMNDKQVSSALIKINTENYNNALSLIETSWEKHFPQKPFDYFFLDESFNKLHQADIKFSKVFKVLTSIAIFIACLGLFALTAYTIERKVKEIGIRKVLGASVKSIVVMISSDILKLIIIANVIAWPVTYWLMENWLSEFAYRIDISFGMFFLSSLLILFISLATISYQSIKAALADPVKSLKYE